MDSLSYVRILPTDWPGYLDLLVYDEDVFKEIKKIVHPNSPFTMPSLNLKKIRLEKRDISFADSQGRKHYRCRLVPGETKSVIEWLNNHGYKIFVSESEVFQKGNFYKKPGEVLKEYLAKIGPSSLKENYVEFEKHWLELCGAKDVLIDGRFSDKFTTLDLALKNMPRSSRLIWELQNL